MRPVPGPYQASTGGAAVIAPHSRDGAARARSYRFPLAIFRSSSNRSSNHSLLNCEYFS